MTAMHPCKSLTALLFLGVLNQSVAHAVAPNFQTRIPITGLRASGTSSGVPSDTTPTPTKNLTASTSSLNAGSVVVDTSSAPQVVTLTNQGTGDVQLATFDINPTTADFSQTNNCPAVLAAKASCTVSVTFRPRTEGTASATLSVINDGEQSPITIALSATGISPTFATWNPDDIGSNLVLSQGNLVVTADGRGGSETWSLVRATTGRSSGKYMFEVTASSNGSTLSAGLASSTASLVSELGKSGIAFGVAPNGRTTLTGVTGKTSYSVSGTTMTFAVDLTAGKAWVGQTGFPGFWWQYGNPETGANPTFTWAPGTLLFPAISQMTKYTYNYKTNFGASSFKTAAPAGYKLGWY